MGDETVQLYVQLRGTSVAQPVRALSGFQRVAVAPGGTKKVTFALGAEAFAFWNEQTNSMSNPPESLCGLARTRAAAPKQYSKSQISKGSSRD